MAPTGIKWFDGDIGVIEEEIELEPLEIPAPATAPVKTPEPIPA